MIFVTGDCHGNFERFKPKYFPEQAQMTKRDIVICAGDFGGVWFGDGRDEAALDWLESLPFTLAFVCGNHENCDALEAISGERLARRQGTPHSLSCPAPDAWTGLRAGRLSLLHHGRSKKP